MTPGAASLTTKAANWRKHTTKLERAKARHLVISHKLVGRTSWIGFINMPYQMTKYYAYLSNAEN